jgi:hypothetical protein
MANEDIKEEPIEEQPIKEQPVPDWFPPKKEPELPPLKIPFEKDQEKRDKKIAYDYLEETELVEELKIKAISLGGESRYIDSLQSVEALKAYIKRLEEEGFKYKRESWRFEEEKAKAKREKLGRWVTKPAKGITKMLTPGRGGRTDIYFPKPGKATGFLTPTVKTTPAAQALIPGGALRMGMPLGKLREATTFKGAMPNPLGDISGLRMKFGMAKEMVMIPGLTKAENLAYQEIRTNGDIDSPAHVASELMELGVSKTEAVKAISGLLAKRLVEKVKDKNFPGEPVLQIAEGKVKGKGRNNGYK